MGEATVPAAPKRIVVLDTGELDSMAALGIKPVGAVSVFQDAGFQPYLAAAMEGVKNVGTIGQPNLEAIAALQPDLIISSEMRHEKIYEELRQIAPTVFTERVGVTWKENFLLHAEAVGEKAEAEAIMARYDQRTGDLKTKLNAANTSVSVIRGLSSEVRVYNDGSFIGTILKDLGFKRPEGHTDDVTFDKAGEEQIPSMDADLMFITHFRPADGGDTALTKLMQHPLWAELNVAKQQQIHEMPDDYWMIGIGISAANKVLDDMEQMLIK